MSGENSITASELHDKLTRFWDEILNVEVSREGLLFTMPASYPDGWQIVLELSQLTPKGFRLSDRGKTLSWLTSRGQNIQTETMKAQLSRISAECGLEENGGVLYRWLSAPLDAADIHVFTEGLVAIAQLHVLHDHRIAEENVAEKVVSRVFHDAGLKPERRHALSITKERKVKVDFFVQQRQPIAMQFIKAKTDMPGTMERWGFRWQELRKNYSGLLPVMLYDRNTQMVDAYSRHIGETECELFCGYDETNRIHEVLEKAK